MQLSDNFCTTTEASRILGLSVGTIHRMVSMGRLKAHLTHGGHRRISRKSLNEYMVVNEYIEVGEQENRSKFHYGDDIHSRVTNDDKDESIFPTANHRSDISLIDPHSDLMWVDERVDRLRIMDRYNLISLDKTLTALRWIAIMSYRPEVAQVVLQNWEYLLNKNAQTS